MIETLTLKTRQSESEQKLASPLLQAHDKESETVRTSHKTEQSPQSFYKRACIANFI